MVARSLDGMPHTARASVGNMCYHVLNRGNARGTVFHKDADYQPIWSPRRRLGRGRAWPGGRAGDVAWGQNTR